MPVNEADRIVITAINATAGARLTIEGRASEGTLGGAILVSLADGRPGVVTRFLGRITEAERTATVMDHARRLGIPVPRHHLVVPIGDDVFIVQERLPGSPPSTVTPETIKAMVELNERFANLLIDRPDVPSLPLCLTHSGDPCPRHEILDGHSDRSRRVLQAIQTIGHRYPAEMTGDDLLHIDLTPANILFDETGTITGVVDWNLGAYRGDRRLALVKTRFDLEWELRAPAPDPRHVAAAASLDTVLAEIISQQDLQRYWAHRMLYQLHWCLQSAPPEVVDWHLDVAESQLGTTAR
jgi:aminoglycoside phosphotransferase (APT) family kinase protein